MDVDTSPSGPQRVEELWFKDGNLVIQAGNRQFRLHRGILAARSPVFQDMLAFPQPPDSELVDGCPLVRLPDAEIDVTHFLKAIFLPEYFLPFPAKTTADIMIGCLRLSHKYGVDYLRRQALIHLSSQCRTTLSGYDGRVTADPDLPPSRVASWVWPDDSVFAICLIHLAREVEALWVLPQAFYDLSSAYGSPNSTFTATACSNILCGAVYNGVRVTLSVQDQHSFFTGHIAHARAACDILRFLIQSEGQGCRTPIPCEGLRTLAMRRSLDSQILDYGHHPLTILWDDDDWHAWFHDACPTCLTGLKTTHAVARQVLWDQLPQIYCLPPWEDLEKMRAAAIGDSVLW